MSQNALLRSMKSYIAKYYDKNSIIVTEDYILCEGTEPIMLVAHMDTVFKTPPKDIYYDQEQRVMWSPQGLGADDRAGVYIIWKIIQSGRRPHICLTTNEEVGGIGANVLIKNLPICPFECKYIIELDRQGTNDCVFYSCANEEFENFIEKYGFITDFGTYSDISDICPKWQIAGVNLSVGYKNEHREIETLNTGAMLATYKKVCSMIDDAKKVQTFLYIPDPYEKYYMNLSKKYLQDYPGWDDDEWVLHQKINGYYPIISVREKKQKCKCCKCNKIYDEDDVFPVKGKDNKLKYYCIDCVSDGVNWCKKCGEPFEITNEDDELCGDCKGEK